MDSISSRTVWIINQYAGTPQTGNPGRHFHIAKEFIKKGYKPIIITASYTHKRECVKSDKKYPIYEEVDGVGFVWIKVFKYKKTHGVGRVLNWFLFSKKISNLNKNLNFIEKPSLIYYSSLSLVGYLGAEKLKNKLKVPLVFEVRDIWPLTLQELKKVSERNLFVIFLKRIELRAYRNSDVLVSNLSNFKKYIDELGFSHKKYVWIPNGISDFDPNNIEISTIKNKDLFKIGYAGSLGLANKMDVLINAANLLKDNDCFEFYILGSGPEIQKLKDICVNKNVFFMEPIPKNEVQYFINSMDACYVGSGKNMLYNYGIGANKFVDYMLSGKPILHSYSGLGDPVEIFDIGLTVPAEDPVLLQNIIIEASGFTQEKLEKIRMNSFNALSEYYSYSKTVGGLIDFIDTLSQ